MEKRSIWEICSDRSQRDRSEIGTWKAGDCRQDGTTRDSQSTV